MARLEEQQERYKSIIAESGLQITVEDAQRIANLTRTFHPETPVFVLYMYSWTTGERRSRLSRLNLPEGIRQNAISDMERWSQLMDEFSRMDNDKGTTKRKEVSTILSLVSNMTIEQVRSLPLQSENPLYARPDGTFYKDHPVMKKSNMSDNRAAFLLTAFPPIV